VGLRGNLCCCAAVFGLSKGYGSKRWRAWAERRIRSRPSTSKSQMLSQAKARSWWNLTSATASSADLGRMCAASGVAPSGCREPSGIWTIAGTRHAFTSSPLGICSSIGGDFQFLVTTSASFEGASANMGFHRWGNHPDRPNRTPATKRPAKKLMPKLRSSRRHATVSFYRKWKFMGGTPFDAVSHRS